MDCTQYITVAAERKKGQHLGREERGAIQYLKRHGLSNRAIARELGCSPTTVGNELRRGTPPRKSNKGRPPGYSAKRGEAVYKANRVRSKRNHKILSCTCFLNWTTTQVRSILPGISNLLALQWMTLSTWSMAMPTNSLVAPPVE